MRAEGEQVAATGTSSNAGGIVVSIRVRLGASRFENLRISRGLARLRVPEGPRAAVPGGVEGEARALASHHTLLVVRTHLKSHGAHHVQVTHAPCVAAFPCVRQKTKTTKNKNINKI